MAPRTRGLKQGLFIFLLSFLVVPIITMLTIAADAEPFAVVISAVLFFVGGLLRMAYAMLFESADAGGTTVEENLIVAAQGLLNRQPNPRGLPSQRDIPASAYVSPPAGNWRNTNDLEPRSVTEPTTKLLEQEEFPQ